MKVLAKIYSSPIAQYIGTRYITYGIQFVNSILIAKYLGVYYFGIYSFLQLVKQYMLYTGMTPSYSLNTILSTRKNESDFANKLWRNSLLLSTILIGGAFTIGVLVVQFYPELFDKYEFSNYSLSIFLIFALNSFNHLFVNLYRTYGLLKKINFFELVIPLSQLCVLFFAKEEDLLYFLLFGTIISNLVSLLLFIYLPPLKVRLKFNKDIFKELLTRGFHLLLYNVSFSLILISSRTLVSMYYSTEELGYYTFAVNLSNAVFMIVGAFGFVMYPKLLNKIYTNSHAEVKTLLVQIRSIYITGCYLLTYIGFFSILFLEYILPQYTLAMPAFKILLLTQLILNNNFGYSILLVAKKREKLMTIQALFAMLLIILISLVFNFIDLSFTMMSIAVSVGFVFYCVSITKRALKEIDEENDLKTVLLEIFPSYYLFPLIILASSIAFNNNIIIPIFSLLIFILMNKDRISDVRNKIYSLISNKESLKF